MDAPFRDTRHALHVSYLVLSLPAREKAPLRNMLIRVLEALPRMTKRQEEWYEQLGGGGTGGGHDPERLSLEEFRAQCAMITDAARTRLPSPEYAAVRARFGQDDEKAAGIKALAVWARRSCGFTAPALLCDLAAWIYLPRAYRGGTSIGDIAERHKVSKTSAFRAIRWMAFRFCELENMAIARLDSTFVAHGVVSSFGCTTCASSQSLTV